MVIAVSGDIDAGEAIAAVRKRSGRCRAAGYAALGRCRSRARWGDQVEERRDKQQRTSSSAIRCAVHRPGPVRARRAGLGPRRDGGRLFVNLRTRIARLLGHLVLLGAVDRASSPSTWGRRRQLDGAIADTLAEIADVKKGGVTREEFERAKKWMIGTYEIGLQSNSSYADKMVYNELYGIGYEETFAAPEKIARSPFRT